MVSKIQIIGVIEARMGSTRFPGKVLEPLAGRSILWHVVQRMRASSMLTRIVLATTTASRDDLLVSHAEDVGVDVVRGSENNLLERHLLVANTYSPDIIVRVTGDCPLVDPLMIDSLVQHLIDTGAGYCTSKKGVPCIHEGIDPFTIDALRKLADKAGNDPIAQEHVCSYFKVHEDFIKIAYIDIDPIFQMKGVRVSVDTPADLMFLEQIYARLGVGPGEADMKALALLLRTHPDLLKINSHVHQKSAQEGTRRALVRCDGDGDLGLGHVIRCLALADELRNSFGFGVTFAIARGEPAFACIENRRYPLEKKPNTDNESEWMESAITKIKPDILVLDIRTDLPAQKVSAWKNDGLFIVVIDDPSERRLCADQAFYPMVPQVSKMNWSGFSGELFSGWEWILLRKDFAICDHKDKPGAAQQILVTMGGSDPRGLTLKAVRALDSIDGDFEIVLIIGPAFMHKQALDQFLLTAKRPYQVQENVQDKDIRNLMAKADLAIASFGVTAYELVSQGTPSILLCISDDHAQSASALHEAGVSISMGKDETVDLSNLAYTIKKLLLNDTQRMKMRQKALSMIDGKGAARCACKIAEAVCHRARHS